MSSRYNTAAYQIERFGFYPKDEVIAVGLAWDKETVEELMEVKLTDEQWDQIVSNYINDETLADAALEAISYWVGEEVNAGK